MTNIDDTAVFVFDPSGTDTTRAIADALIEWVEGGGGGRGDPVCWRLRLRADRSWQYLFSSCDRRRQWDVEYARCFEPPLEFHERLERRGDVGFCRRRCESPLHAIARRSCCSRHRQQIHGAASALGSCACERFGCLGAAAGLAARAAALLRCGFDAARGSRRQQCPDGGFDRWVLHRNKFEVRREYPCECFSETQTSATALGQTIARVAVETRGWESRGLFYYPPGGCREWHTNERDPPGWRLYVSYTQGTSHFHYVDDHRRAGDGDGAVVSQKERGALVRMFRVQDGSASSGPVLWHAVSASPSGGRRWSVGFRLRDEQAADILHRARELKSKRKSESNSCFHPPEQTMRREEDVRPPVAATDGMRC